MALSESQKKAHKKWDSANVRHIGAVIRLELYNLMSNHIRSTGDSISGFIVKAIIEKLNRDRPSKD